MKESDFLEAKKLAVEVDLDIQQIEKVLPNERDRRFYKNCLFRVLGREATHQYAEEILRDEIVEGFSNLFEDDDRSKSKLKIIEDLLLPRGGVLKVLKELKEYLDQVKIFLKLEGEIVKLNFSEKLDKENLNKIVEKIFRVSKISDEALDKFLAREPFFLLDEIKKVYSARRDYRFEMAEYALSQGQEVAPEVIGILTENTIQKFLKELRSFEG